MFEFFDALGSFIGTIVDYIVSTFDLIFKLFTYVYISSERLLLLFGYLPVFISIPLIFVLAISMILFFLRRG